jgi:tripartite motif-containing protein 37
VINGLTWRLKTYPNGTGVARGVFLSVFIEMYKGLKEPARYEYRVEMVNHKNRNASVVREFASLFEVGECWGYNKFYRLDLLEKEGFILPDQDVIVFRFYIRPPNHHEKCREQQKYIKNLEESRRLLQLQNEEYRKQISEISGAKHDEQAPQFTVQLKNEEEVADCAAPPGESEPDDTHEIKEDTAAATASDPAEEASVPAVDSATNFDEKALTPLMIARAKKRQSLSQNRSVKFHFCCVLTKH